MKIFIYRIKVKEPNLLILSLVIACAVFNYSTLFGGYPDDAGRQTVAYVSATESSGQEEGWLSVESNFFTIYYTPTADLNAIYRRLNRRVFYIEDIYERDSLSDPAQMVAHRMDILYRRAQDLLDIHLAKLHVKIRIFRDREALNDQYESLFRKRPDYKSFYIYKLGTIYTSETDICDSVISHEMGHAIVDNYFLVTPPPKIGELLASYVDLHLED